MTNPILHQTSNGWEFLDESILEDFIWENLQEIFGLYPLFRQYSINTERCDILAVDDEKRLHVIELKNIEDRYIVQQLTRYYDSLITNKPFDSRVDYNLPIELISVTPSYHKHNLVDAKYNTLKFDFLDFIIEERDEELWFILKGSKNLREIKINSPIKESEKNLNIHPIPEPLKSWLMAYDTQSQNTLQYIRETILSSNSKIKEIKNGSKFYYGISEKQLIAEIAYSKKYKKPILFLWLPLPSNFAYKQDESKTGRLRIWLEEGLITHVGHIPQDFGRMKTESEWSNEKKKPALISSLTYKSMTPVNIQWYFSGDEKFEMSHSLEKIVDLSLNCFRTKYL